MLVLVGRNRKSENAGHFLFLWLFSLPGLRKGPLCGLAVASVKADDWY